MKNPYVTPGVPRTLLETFTHYMCGRSGITIGQIKSECQDRELVVPRQIIMHVFHYHSELTHKFVAGYFDRDHSTSIYSVKTIDGFLETDKAFKAEFDGIMRDFYEIKQRFNEYR